MFERLTPIRIARSIAFRTVRFFKLPAKTDELALKADGLALKVDGLALKVDGLALKADELALKADALAPKVDGLVLKVDELILKVDGLARKADEVSIPKPYFLSADVSAAKQKLLKESASLPYPENYAVSKRWRSLLDQVLEKADRMKSPPELAWFAQHVFDVEPMPITNAIYTQYEAESRAFRNRYPELSRVTESSFLTADEIAVIDGLGYSAKIAQAFTYYADIHDGIDDIGSIKTIVEIGSGNGRMARLMRLADPSRKYVLVDLAESLFFAYAFLRSNFPDARLHIVSSGETITDLGGFDFVFCPVQLVSGLQIPDVDLAINTYSFAEMTQGCVDYLMNALESVLKPRFLYSLNLVFVNKQIYFDTGGYDGEGSDTVLNVKPMWLPRRFVLVPAADNGQNRITGSVILERSGLPPDQLLAEIARREEATSDLHETAGLRFFRAAWSRDAGALDRLCESLKAVYQSFGFPEPNLSEIGEVKFLKEQRALN